MIRVVVIAETHLRAEAVASVLAEEAGFNLLHVGARTDGHFEEFEDIADVLVAVGIANRYLSSFTVPLVIVSDGAVDESLCLANGRAWLPSDVGPAELRAAVIAAASNLVVLTQDQVRRRTQRDGGEWQEAQTEERLTRREEQVLLMLADGLGNKEIAAQLGISDSTAKFHVAQIMAKLGAHSRTEAVAIGMRRGLVPV